MSLEMHRHSRIFLAFVLLLTFSTAVPADACGAGAETLPLPGRWRGFGVAGHVAQWLRFEVDSPAVVTLDVTAALAALGEPVLTVLGPDCEAREDDFAFLERTPSHQVLRVHTPGEYFLRVTAVDPEQPLRSYKVTTGLAEEPGTVLTTKETEEIEIDPDGLRSDPDVFVACAGEVDDHGDTASCATPLPSGREVKGRIGNAWGDDADVFRFTLAEPRIVEVEAHSGTDTVGGLFHRDGHRLAVDDDGGEGADFRIVKALGPGQYFVRVEGLDVTEQVYSLGLETRDW